MKDLYIVTYYVWNSDFTESHLYEVMIASESVCKGFIERFDFNSDIHGYGMMSLKKYLEYHDFSLDDVLYRISKFI